MTQPRLLGGRYELDGVIGRGGMAEVYRARDLRLDRVVAIKTLRSDLARDPTFQARFRREAQSAASLNHPSVIAVYDTGEDTMDGNPVPYIVMEYVEGRTLRDVLQEQHRLRPEQAMEMTDGILRALDYSHRGGIVHRDIKPANVMLTSSGEVKVMDFGIARALADSAATMTATAQVIGTAQYLSPEQARGERVDARSDIYSTGCVLYELMAGRPPFQGDSPVAIAYQHVREEPVPLSRLDPSIPQWADAIVMKALAKDANHRYQSAAEMRADIQRALQGMPIAAPTMAMSAGTQVMQGGPGTQSHRPTTMSGYDLPPVDYQEAERPEGRGKQIALWSVVGLLTVGAVVALIAMFSTGGGPAAPTDVAIPTGIVGNDQAAAKGQLQALGFVPTNIKSKRTTSDTVPRDSVISVDPAEKTTIAKDKVATTIVTLTISSGKPRVVVPDVADQTADSAQAALEQKGFKVETSTISSRQPKGHVVKTDPAGGDRAEKGSTVTMYVSKGPVMVSMPDVRNLQKNDALSQLRSAGLKAQVQEVDNTDVAPGTVINQSIPPNQKVQAGTTVLLTVAKAPDQSPPPGFPSGPPGTP